MVPGSRIVTDAWSLLQHLGFLKIKVSSTLQRQLDDLYCAATNFFQSSSSDKQMEVLPADAGYRPYGIEYSQSQYRPDVIESFSVSRQVGAEGLLRSDAAKKLHHQMLLTFDSLERIAEEHIVHLASTLTSSAKGERLRGGLHLWSDLQINNTYVLPESSTYISDPHEDGCLITLMSNTGAGLEFQSPSGSFTPVSVSKDELFLIPGEILWLLSGGAIQPMHHRVRRCDNKHSRMALLFFADLDPNLCVPWVPSDINRGVDIGEHVLNNPTRHGLKRRLPR